MFKRCSKPSPRQSIWGWTSDSHWVLATSAPPPPMVATLPQWGSWDPNGKLYQRATHTGGVTSKGWSKLANRCTKACEREWSTHPWFIPSWDRENSVACLLCMSYIAGRQEAWRLSNAAHCILQLATHLFGRLFGYTGGSLPGDLHNPLVNSSRISPVVTLEPI